MQGMQCRAVRRSRFEIREERAKENDRLFIYGLIIIRDFILII